MGYTDEVYTVRGKTANAQPCLGASDLCVAILHGRLFSKFHRSRQHPCFAISRVQLPLGAPFIFLYSMTLLIKSSLFRKQIIQAEPEMKMAQWSLTKISWRNFYKCVYLDPTPGDYDSNALGKDSNVNILTMFPS